MEQSGEYQIAADREAVWQALNDPEVLGACIPGCQSIERTQDDTFAARIKAKIGPVSATFDALIALTDLNPPESYTLNANAKGGAAGFGKGTAQVRLAAQGSGRTTLSYSVAANVGGKLAQVGSRLIDGAARKMADDFFGAFSALFAEPVVAESTAGPQTDAAPPAAGAGQAIEPGSNKEDRYEKSGKMLVFALAFGVLIVALILAF